MLSKKKKDLIDRIVDMMNKIEWKDIYLDDNKSYYQISDNGNIININDGRIRSTAKTPNGYLTLILYMNKKEYPKSVHRLVAEAFIPNPDNKPQVNHKDGDKLNNHVSNLEWVTSSENMQHAIEIGLHNPRHGNQPRGSKSGVSKHTEEQAHAVCKLLEQEKGNMEIARELNLGVDFVRTVKRGHWPHVTSQYNIPKHNLCITYTDEMKSEIRNLVKNGLNNREILSMLGLPNTKHRRRYIEKFRDIDKSSTTIPRAEMPTGVRPEANAGG